MKLAAVFIRSSLLALTTVAFPTQLVSLIVILAVQIDSVTKGSFSAITIRCKAPASSGIDEWLREREAEKSLVIWTETGSPDRGSSIGRYTLM